MMSTVRSIQCTFTLESNLLLGQCTTLNQQSRTLYIQTYVDTTSNQEIWLFQPHQLLTGVYNRTQSHVISIDKHWQQNGLTEELSDFHGDTVIGCNFLTSQFVKFLQWKRLGATTAQPQSGRPHKLTEFDCQVQECIARKNCLSSVATLTTEF